MRVYIMALAILAVLATAGYMGWMTIQDIQDEAARLQQGTTLQQERMNNIIQNDMTDQYILPDPSPSIPDTGGELPAMTGEECAAAGAEAGWSATWGPASDGCWIISPDGSEVRHLGTWKE